MLLIPAIDLRLGRCVRLYQGDFAAETRYALDPRELLGRYGDLGASWVHVVDLDGAKDGLPGNRPLILALAAESALTLQVGGGVRSAAILADLIDHGIARAVVGSTAIERPHEVIAWLEQYGPERLCVAFDVRIDERGEPRVHTRGWTEGGSMSLWSAVEPFCARGLRHVLCTDIGRDGALAGPNLDLYRAALERFPELAWQASGGVRDAADLAALESLGVRATVCGKALLEARITIEELRSFWPNASSPASTSAAVKS